MPFPRALARFNRRVVNRVTGRFAGRLPWFAIVIHRGRVTGRTYRTPVNAFRSPGNGYVIGLSYGPRTDWARNVLAEGGCAIETCGRRLDLVNPRVVRDPQRRLVPAPARLTMRLIRADLFLCLDQRG
jgi:deazaflavin-dependent oxidoreductase (nitroreductase family)